MDYLFKLFEMLLLALFNAPGFVACIIDVVTPYVMGVLLLLSSSLFSVICNYIIIVFYGVKESIKGFIWDIFGFDIFADSDSNTDNKEPEEKKEDNKNWWIKAAVIFAAAALFTFGCFYFAAYFDGPDIPPLEPVDTNPCRRYRYGPRHEWEPHTDADGDFPPQSACFVPAAGATRVVAYASPPVSSYQRHYIGSPVTPDAKQLEREQEDLAEFEF